MAIFGSILSIEIDVCMQDQIDTSNESDYDKMINLITENWLKFFTHDYSTARTLITLYRFSQFNQELNEILLEILQSRQDVTMAQQIDGRLVFFEKINP